ncbi:hypothetical protein [Agrobacterium sp. NPDC090273]|uniref:hypothetical protein n=1 Tax=Agrobacterium TaxID=357 RepID=UPI00110F3F7E|nr:hypothetical protein [Agrobacterium tumefaciens]NWJ25923.1 hypothetical protein [Rhizobium sp. RM]TMV15798.1 hypothetical protein BJG94_21950 [Rhizobium sp. Td3]UXS01168.1 hypothetical protein FY156_06520 [Agrobacterium tumefaciens]
MSVSLPGIFSPAYVILAVSLRKSMAVLKGGAVLLGGEGEKSAVCLAFDAKGCSKLAGKLA